MRLRCPCCHAEFNPESALEDAVAREMMGLLADLPREVSRPLAAYLGLWRSKSRALAWERALRVAQEALSMSHNHQQLGKALSETVESLRKKQEAGNWKPLTGHNYLKQVLESQPAISPQAVAVCQQHEQPQPTGSKTRQAVERLMRKRDA